MPRDPRLVNALLNVPSNWLSELERLRLRVEDLEVSSAPLPEEITRGRLSIADLIISPAQGIEIANPVNANFTGAFMAGQGIEFDSVRYVLGNVINGELKTGFTELGTLFATEALISGTLTADAGLIGGWEITATTIESLISDIGIVLDSAAPEILVGDTSGVHIILDGANQSIRSSNYVAGASGSNWDTATGDMEINNLIARGMIRTAVFEKDVISSIGGSLLVLDSDVLEVDMSALDSASLTIQGNTTFAVGDILRMKDGLADEWFEVTSIAGAPTYAVTRDKAGVYSADNNPAWKKGQAVVKYGVTGEGGISLEGGATPRLSLFTHEGEPWNSIVEEVVMESGTISAGAGAVTIDGYGITDNTNLNTIRSVLSNNISFIGRVWYFLSASVGPQVFGLHSFHFISATARFEDGFEDGTLDAWSTSGTPEIGEDQPAKGKYYAALSGTETISKTLSASIEGPDTYYFVSCLYRSSVSGGGLQLTFGTGSNLIVHSLTDLPANEWLRAYMVFKAPNTTTPTLTFGSSTGSVTIDIDDVYVNEMITIGIGVGAFQRWGVLLSNIDIYGEVTLYSETGTERGILNSVAAETNANDIFRCDSPGGVSAFAGTIATLPGGATLTYNVSSGQEGAMVPTSTSQLAKMRLYNTTRGTSALISNCVVGTNTLTLTANVPAGWQVGDTITIASQTVSGGGFSWFDLEITSGPTDKSALFLTMRIGSATVGDVFNLHPFESYAGSKRSVLNNLATTGGTFGCYPVVITGNVFSASWTGTPTSIIITESGYLA